MKDRIYTVSIIHPYYVEYGIVSPIHIVDKEIKARGIFDLIKNVNKQYPRYQIDKIIRREINDQI